MKLTAELTGSALLGWPRTLKEMGPNGKAAVKRAMEQGASDIAADARRRVRISSGGPNSRKAKSRPGPGELRSTIRAEKSNTDAPVAYVKAGYGKLRRRSTAKTAKGKARAENLRARARDAMIFPGSAASGAGQAAALGVYAMTIEYGSPRRGIPAQRFMRNAREANRVNVKNRAENALREAVRRSGG